MRIIENDDIFAADPNHRDLLKESGLIPMLIDEIHKKVVREDDTILSLININGVRLVKNANPTSGNLCLNSKSRAGKDWVARNTYEVIMPNKDEFIHCSRISPTTFNYWHRDEPNWTWDGKQLLLEDIESDIINCPVFKTMASGTNKATIVINNEAVDIHVLGKPHITITGHNIDLGQEAIGRFPIIHLDESEEQTMAIKRFMSETAKAKLITKSNRELRDSLKRLKRIDVVIPFADALPKLFPNTLLMRDIFSRFIDYIKGSTAIHQFQREKDKQGRYIAIYDDYFIAKISLLKTYSNSQMISTTLNDEKALKFIAENEPVTKKEIMDGTGLTPYYIYQNLSGFNKLEENGLIYSQLIPHEDANRKVANFFLTRDEKATMLPLFPNGITIDNEKKRYLLDLKKNGFNRNTIIPNHNANKTYNCNSIMVFMYLLNKSKEYYCEDMEEKNKDGLLFSEKPKNHKHYPYFWLFDSVDGISNKTLLEIYNEYI